MNSTTFVLFGKYCPIVDQLGSKNSFIKKTNKKEKKTNKHITPQGIKYTDWYSIRPRLDCEKK